MAYNPSVLGGVTLRSASLTFFGPDTHTPRSPPPTEVEHDGKSTKALPLINAFNFDSFRLWRRKNSDSVWATWALFLLQKNMNGINARLFRLESHHKFALLLLGHFYFVFHFCLFMNGMSVKIPCLQSALKSIDTT